MKAIDTISAKSLPHASTIVFLRWAAVASGAAACLIGLVALGGWFLGNPALKSFAPGFPEMKANSAIAMSLAGASLLLFLHPGRRLAVRRSQIATAAFVMLIGLLTLSQHLFDWNLGIDELFFREQLGAASLTPNRMAPNTAMIFLLLGSSLLMLGIERLRRFSAFPVLLSGLLVLPTLMSFFYNIDFIYASRSYRRIAFPTAAAFTLLCIGILAAYPKDKFTSILAAHSAGGYLARRLLPLSLLLPVLVSWPIVAGEKAGHYNAETGLFLIIAVLTIVFTIITVRNARSIHRYDLQQKQLEAQLRRAKQNLERLVSERTKQLTRTNQELERSNRELQDFAYVASHDLQEPLRKIQSFSNLLGQDAAKFSEDERLYVDRIASAASRMSSLISDLLTFSRVTTKAQPFQAVDLRRIAEEVVGDLEIRISETGATVDIGRLPTIQADPVQMRQLFQNLLSNSLKFGRPDAAPIVKVRATKRSTALALTFSDNGIGFEQKYAERIFTIFERLHARTEYTGTGIGLAIVKKIIDRHHGTIAVKSKPGKGTTFTITLSSTNPGKVARGSIK